MQHHFPPPHRARRPHLNPLLPVAPSLAICAPQPRGWRTQINEVVISRILAEHQGVARRFSISPFIIDNDSDKLDRWLRSPILDKVQELNFSFYAITWPSPPMPHSALRFSSLRVAEFGSCEFPDDAAHQVHFPNLQHLTLGSVTISEDSLRTMLAGCPALEKFVFRYMDGREYLPEPLPPSALHLSSTLRYAEFGCCQFPKPMDCHVHFPNLQQLIFETVAISEGSLHAMLSGCPALNNLLLGFSSGFRQFRINSLKRKHVEMYFHRSDADRLQGLIIENALNNHKHLNKHLNNLSTETEDSWPPH